MVQKQVHVMGNIVRTLILSAACLALPLAAQNYRAPRAPDGHADLNGIWQALNEANYDIEAHVARPAMALRPGPYGPVPAAQVVALGAAGSVPPGVGVVEGGALPYKPEALAPIRQIRRDRCALDSNIDALAIYAQRPLSPPELAGAWRIGFQGTRRA